MGDTSGPQRILYLDGIRGLLALSVVASHIYGGITGWAPERPFVGAYLAVDFFFILSGYVLSHMLLRESSPSWPRFAAKRVFRLWPLHIACLLFTLAVMNNNDLLHQYVPAWWKALTEEQILGNALLLQNVGIPHIPVINAPSWSISIEFWVSSTVLFFAARSKSVWPSVALLLLGAMLIAWSMRTVHPQFLNSGGSGVMRGIVGMMLGSMALRAQKAGIGERFHAFGAMPVQAVIISALSIAIYCYERHTWLDIPILLSFTLLIFFMRHDRGFGWIFSLMPFVWLGEMSFAIYLCHTPIMLMMPPMVYAQQYLDYAPLFLFALVMPVAYVLHAAVEKPSRSFLYGLIRSRRTVSATNSTQF